jgi:GntR family transcriptional regulator
MKVVKRLAGDPSPDDAGEWLSPVRFRIDTGSGVAIYLQLVHQVENALRLGHLRVGDQLPRVRDVVGALSINPNTVAKAYRELEHKGYVAGRVGQGTFIVASPATVAPDELNALRESLVRGWLGDAIAAGLSEEEIIALFMAALRGAADGATSLKRSAAGGPGRPEEVVA